jgi:hypothetical protein
MELVHQDGEYERFDVVLRGTSDEVDAWFAAIEGLEDTTGPIVDDWGVTHENMRLDHVGPRDKQKEASGGYIGRLQLTCCKVRK